MGKTRVGVLLRETMGGNKSTNKSQDLAEYTKKYGVFCKKIRNLIEALKTHHQNLARIDASRQDVSFLLGLFSILLGLQTFGGTHQEHAAL